MARVKNTRFVSRGAELLDPDEILADSISVLRSGVAVAEGKIEKPIGRFAGVMFLSLIAIGMSYLLWRAWTLQVKQGDELFAKAQENRFLTRLLLPPRGIINDRFGVGLVENIPSFGLMFKKNDFLNAVRLVKKPRITCAELSGLNVSGADGAASLVSSPSRKEVLCVSPDGRADETAALLRLVGELGELLAVPPEFFTDIGFPEHGEIRELPSHIVIVEDIAVEKIAEIAARIDSLPGIEIVEAYRRSYRDPYALSHVLGYTGKMSEEDQKKNDTYGQEETIGKNGLEAFYDMVLRGTPGKKIVEVDSRGRETRFRINQEPRLGSSLSLTLDADLQRFAYDTLARFVDGKKGGSVVIMDAQTGAIRALISYPGFDINRMGSELTPKAFAALLANRLTPFFNRAISGQFPSGSIIKPIFAGAALQEHLISTSKKIYDTGSIEIPNPYHAGQVSVFKDWKAHGWVDFYDAIAQSANVYFYMIGGGWKDQVGLGIERLKKYANAFGLGDRSGIDLPGEKSGFIPDPSTKYTFDPSDPTWRIGDTYNVSIGQGGVRVTPLQMTALTAAIANGGRLYRPYLVDTIQDTEGHVIKKTSPTLIREGMVSEENLREVRSGMRQTVTRGTARSLGSVPIPVAAKTGTAQSGQSNPHAWVTVFAPYDKPEIAITTMAERAGEGSSIAVPITREILQWYFAGRYGEAKMSSEASANGTAVEREEGTGATTTPSTTP